MVWIHFLFCDYFCIYTMCIETSQRKEKTWLKPLQVFNNKRKRENVGNVYINQFLIFAFINLPEDTQPHSSQTLGSGMVMHWILKKKTVEFLIEYAAQINTEIKIYLQDKMQNTTYADLISAAGIVKTLIRSIMLCMILMAKLSSLVTKSFKKQ